MKELPGQYIGLEHAGSGLRRYARIRIEARAQRLEAPQCRTVSMLQFWAQSVGSVLHGPKVFVHLNGVYSNSSNRRRGGGDARHTFMELELSPYVMRARAAGAEQQRRLVR